MSEIKKDLKKFFKENNGVYYQRQLCMIFEDQYPDYRTRDKLKEVVKEENWINMEKEKWKGNPVYFYFSNQAREVETAKTEIKNLIKELDGNRKGNLIGKRAKEVVKRTLIQEDFEFIAEDSQEYNGKTWNKDDRDLDLILEKQGQGFGFEVKNKNSTPSKKQLDQKIEICEYLGIKLVYAARFIPSKRREYLLQEGHYFICFNNHLIPPQCSELESKMRALEGFSPYKEKTLPPEALTGIIAS